MARIGSEAGSTLADALNTPMLDTDIEQLAEPADVVMAAATRAHALRVGVWVLFALAPVLLLYAAYAYGELAASLLGCVAAAGAVRIRRALKSGTPRGLAFDLAFCATAAAVVVGNGSAESDVGYATLYVALGAIGGAVGFAAAALGMVGGGALGLAEVAGALPWSPANPVVEWSSAAVFALPALGLSLAALRVRDTADVAADERSSAYLRGLDQLQSVLMLNDVRARHGEAVGRLGLAIVRAEASHEFGRTAAAIIADTLGVRRVGIFLCGDSPAEPMRLHGAYRFDERPGRIELVAPLELRAALTEGHGVVQLRDPAIDGTQTEGTTLAAVIPGRRGAQGVVWIVARTNAVFARVELEFVETITSTLAAALERDQVERRLLQSQKLEAVGQLAGGIAHDFNNLLCGIMSSAELLQFEVAEDAVDVHELIQEILEASDRAAMLTRQLLTYSRKQYFEPESLDLGEIVGGFEKVICRLIEERVTIAVDRSEQELPIEADKTSIEQVLLNLAVNARDAIPATGGTITIQTRLTEEAGMKWAELVVSDDGVGMDDATRARVFEPFFTTKPQGQGTGLGLATVYGVVEQLGGTVKIDSVVGKGTRVRVRLPAKTASSAKDSEQAVAPASVTGGRLLLVEDDDAVRRTTARMLRASGYEVHVVDRAWRALQLLRDDGLHFDVVLSDVVMPEMSGFELLKSVREEGIAVPLALMSGYSDVGDRPEGEGAPILQKPFTRAELLAFLEEHLGLTPKEAAA